MRLRIRAFRVLLKSLRLGFYNYRGSKKSSTEGFFWGFDQDSFRVTVEEGSGHGV